MTSEAFHRMEWDLGWKYEYWNGCAHISPRAAAMSCVLRIGPRASASGALDPRPVRPSDRDDLILAYLAAFEDSVDYCDWPAEKIREHAEENVDGFFAGSRGEPLPASRILRRSGESPSPLLGALLVVETRPGHALLDLLFVVPWEQRRGLATAMASSAITELERMGFRRLESRYLLANQASRAWHHRFGFVDEPDLMSARALLAHARHAMERQRLLDGADPHALSRAASELARWKAEVERLDAEAERQWRARRPAPAPQGPQGPRGA